jgi:hypothetical protein
MGVLLFAFRPLSRFVGEASPEPSFDSFNPMGEELSEEITECFPIQKRQASASRSRRDIGALPGSEKISERFPVQGTGCRHLS